MSEIAKSYGLSIWSVIGATSVAAAVYLFFGRKKKKDGYIYVKPAIDLNKQSVMLPGPERIRASVWGCPNDDPTQYLITLDPNCTTVYENFLKGKRLSNNGRCLGIRTGPNGAYEWQTYGEVAKRIHNFGAGLLSIGAQPSQDTFIGIYSVNCPEWAISKLALSAHSMVTVPLYDTLGADAVSYIINQASIEYAVCDNVDKAKKLLAANDSESHLKHVIVIREEITPDLKAAGAAKGITFHRFAEVEKLGASHPTELHPAKPDDTYIVCYTSGTTGNPKGVMLSHKSLMSQTACFEYYMKHFSGQDLDPANGASTLSFLPLAHMFEQMAHTMMFSMGHMIGYSSGDARKIPQDMQTLRPTLLPVVPRLLNRIYDQIAGKLDSGSAVARTLFNMAYNSKLNEMKNEGLYRTDGIWDKLIFNKIRAQVGGKVSMMVTGSAPISGEVLTMCRVCLGANIAEGYGQTECTAACSVTIAGDFTPEHVGAPLPCCQIKLVDVPDLDYYGKDDKGEICVRGPIVMKGYFKQPEKTAETIDEEGWLHTGDIGRWLPNGTLKIIDRKKHIFKLAQGEYVAPEKIEGVYMRCPIVEQVFVDGNSLERYLVAIVVPNPHELNLLAKEKGVNVDGQSFEYLCKNATLREGILERMKKMGKENKLNSIEQVQSIFLSSELFSVENGLLTPTLKSKRPQLRKHYQDTMDMLYREKK